MASDDSERSQLGVEGGEGTFHMVDEERLPFALVPLAPQLSLRHLVDTQACLLSDRMVGLGWQGRKGLIALLCPGLRCVAGGENPRKPSPSESRIPFLFHSRDIVLLSVSLRLKPLCYISVTDLAQPS